MGFSVPTGLDKPAYSLKNLLVVCANGASALISLSIKRNPIYDKKHPGAALAPSQVYLGEDFPSIEAEFYNDDSINFGMVFPNQAIESFSVDDNGQEEAYSFLSNLFVFFPPSSMVFGGGDTNLGGDKISTLKLPIMCNVLNPGEFGGYPLAAGSLVGDDDESPGDAPGEG